MQVSLLSVPDVALTGSRAGGMVLCALGSSSQSPAGDQTEGLRARVRRDEQREAEAVATLVPTRSVDVINQAERNVERSSRAFRRQLAREGAAEQFREDRQAFRRALTEAEGKGSRATSRGPANTRLQTGARIQAGRDVNGATDGAGKAPRSASDAAAKAPATDSAHPPTKPHAGSTFASVRAAIAAGSMASAGAGSAAGFETFVPNMVPLRVVRADPGVSRVASSAPVRAAAKSGGTAGAKAGANPPGTAHSTRGPGKGASLSAAKTDGSRPAENAARDANIERIVRLVRSRISGERAHAVLRLDPPELGRLRLHMDLRGTALALRVDTSTEVAHRLLCEDVGKLRDGLDAAGIQLERIEIRPPTLAPEPSGNDGSQHADPHENTQGESNQTDAEHPEERGRDSYPADATEGTSREIEPEPAAESLVNVVA